MFRSHFGIRVGFKFACPTLPNPSYLEFPLLAVCDRGTVGLLDLERNISVRSVPWALVFASSRVGWTPGRH